MVDTAVNIWRNFITDGVPSSGKQNPEKAAIREWGTYLESLAALAFTSSLVYSTRAALYANLVPAANAPALVVGDPTAGYDGIYMKVGATTTGSWTRLGDVPGRQYIKATDAGAGTANAIVATTDIPLPSADRAAIITLNIYEANTATPVTVAFNGGTALTIKTLSGNNVAAGGLPSSAVVAGYVSGATFRLLSDQASAAIQSAAEAAQTTAEAAAAAAEAAAAGVNLPSVTSADARKELVVKGDGSGFEVRARHKILVGAYSQSNFNNPLSLTWTPPANLFVWNGGHSATVPGTEFAAPSGSTIDVPNAVVAEWARRDPSNDYYLVNCSIGGAGIRSSVGMPYLWDSATSGDPGTGSIGLNNADETAATVVRYSETDADGFNRFYGVQDLYGTAYVIRIEVIGDEANTYVEFTSDAVETDSGTYRTQSYTYSGSANWPPADDTPVRVWQGLARLDQIMETEFELAFDALSLSGGDLNFDTFLLWPTESSSQWEDAYLARDHELLQDFLATWCDFDTQFIYTLPLPHTPNQQIVDDWWTVIRRIVSEDPSRRKLVDLRSTAQSDWGAVSGYVHIANGSSTNKIGKLIARSAMTGGAGSQYIQSGRYTPTITNGANVSANTTYELLWTRIGFIVTVHFVAQVTLTTTNTSSIINVSLPVPSNFTSTIDLTGSFINDRIGARSSVSASTSTDDALFFMLVSTTGVHTLYGEFSYRVRP